MAPVCSGGGWQRGRRHRPPPCREGAEGGGVPRVLGGNRTDSHQMGERHIGAGVVGPGLQHSRLCPALSGCGQSRVQRVPALPNRPSSTAALLGAEQGLLLSGGPSPH